MNRLATSLSLALLSGACADGTPKVATPTAPSGVVIPPPSPSARPGLSGLVFEATPNGMRPIEGAEVLTATDFLDIEDYWKAKTAADGHYEFPDVWGNVVFVLARKEGYHQSAQVTLAIGRSQAVTHNVELKRQ